MFVGVSSPECGHYLLFPPPAAKINKRPCDHNVGTVSHLRDSRPPPTSLVLTHSLTPVYTPALFQASTSPLLVGGTGTVSRVPEPPHPITPSQFYGTANEHNPSETTNESNAILTNSATSPVPVAPNPTVAQEPKKKSKRGRRPKRQRNKSKANTTAPLSREQPTDAGPVSNAHNPSPPSLSAMAADMPPHQQQSHHQHHRSGVDTGQTRLPVREMIVRVKQEPLSNHEDEMETTESEWSMATVATCTFVALDLGWQLGLRHSVLRITSSVYTILQLNSVI